MSETADPRRKLVLIVVSAVAACSLLAALFAYASWRAGAQRSNAEMFAQRGAAPDGALPELWSLPRFSFRDQHGNPQSEQSLRGRVLIGDFIFTTCTSVCPLITAKMRLLQRQLLEPKLGFVSFSVDPAHDSPEALAHYAQIWNPSETRWTLLSTDPPGLAALADGMHVAVEPSEDRANPIIHSSLFFLIDAAGKVRGFYDSADEAALERLVRDTRKLLGSAAVAASSAKSGAELYAELGCAACHENPKLAPPLGGIKARPVALQSGESVLANREYLRESLLAPGQKLVAGYVNLMPAYDKALSRAELEHLLDFVEGMPAANTAPGSASATPKALTAANSATMRAGAASQAGATPVTSAPMASAAATLATDPVCKMTVRAAPDTTHLTHAGETYYFCSDSCRDAFSKAPEKYLSKK